MARHRPKAPEPAPARAPACGEEAARAMAARQLEVLSELMESGLRFVRAIEAQVREPDAPRVAEGDVVLAFHRATRAVRLTIALQARLLEDQQRPGSGASGTETRIRVVFVGDDGVERDYAETIAPQATVDPAARKAEVAGAVRKVARASLIPGELDPREAAEAVERLVREGTERLERESEFTDLLRRPTSELVALICRDLGLTVDWPGLAEEAWALQEMHSGKVGEPLEPLATPSLFSSPASGDREAEARSSQRGPAQPVEGAQPPPRPFRLGASRRATFPARGEGERARPPP